MFIGPKNNKKPTNQLYYYTMLAFFSQINKFSQIFIILLYEWEPY